MKTFQYFIHTIYLSRINYLTENYDGYASTKRFTLQHALKCKTVGIVVGRHNDLRDYLVIMFNHAFSYYSIHYEPIIFPIQYRTGEVDLWTRQMEKNTSYPYPEPVEGLKEGIHICQLL